MAKSVDELINNKQYMESDLFQYENAYHSFSHHSRFSDMDKTAALERINLRMKASAEFLQKADFMTVTFGTSYVYFLKETLAVVSNCHKLPEKYFVRKRLTVEEIVNDWQALLNKLQNHNPKLRIIFTVSPVRHFRDGFHENQLSKSALLLAVDELIKTFPDFCAYFPAYEILLDDLRDYRFYGSDLVHPSDEALEYIWEKFSQTFFSETTAGKAEDFIKQQKRMNHRQLIKTESK
jgi:hypothetical protein